MPAQLLVHFLDGSTQGCAQETPWSAFTHEGERVEWCEATSIVVARVIAVRLRGEASPVLGAAVASEASLTEKDAHAALHAHGGRESLRPPPSIQPLRRMSERPKEQPWFGSLVRLGFVSDNEITKFLSRMYRVPTINLEEFEVELEVIILLSKEQCEKHRAVPVARAGGALIVAMADPTQAIAMGELRAITGLNVEPVIASEEAIKLAITRYYG